MPYTTPLKNRGWLHKKRKMDIGYNYSTPEKTKTLKELIEIINELEIKKIRYK